MKICPICNERYDEEIIKFCTNDGTPLIDEDQPSFTALPSETADQAEDEGEETVVRLKPIIPDDEPFEPSEPFVIPTSAAKEQQVRPRTAAVYYPPPREPNTGKIVALTILGTLAVLGLGAALFWLFQKETPPTNVNTNINAVLGNQNTNLNANLGFDSNFNFNANGNFNSDYNSNFNINNNLNANVKSPTPKTTPSPKPSPTPDDSPDPSPSPRPTANTRPSPTPTPRTSPRPPTMTSNRPTPDGN